MKFEEKIKDLSKLNFFEISNATFSDLCEHNKEFKRLRKESRNIIEKYPKVNAVCCEKEFRKLSNREIKALIKYLKLKSEEDMIYEQELFLSGMKTAYIFFKQIDILKENFK